MWFSKKHTMIKAITYGTEFSGKHGSGVQSVVPENLWGTYCDEG